MHWISNYLKWIIVVPLASAQYYQRSSLIPGTNPRINSAWDARPKSPYHLYRQGVPSFGGFRSGQPHYDQPQYGKPQYGHGQHGQPHSSSGYGGHSSHSSHDKSQIFPYYIEEYFKFRSHLNVAMNRIDNAEATMTAVENELETAEGHLDAIKDALEDIPDTCPTTNTERNTNPNEAFVADNRCFEVYTDAVTYEEAVAACIGLGGTLATPSLHPDSEFGRALESETSAVASDAFWIGGFRALAADDFVMRNGFVIASSHVRWTGGAPGAQADVGLTVIITEDASSGVIDFEIGADEDDDDNEYVCEFKPILPIPIPGGTLTAHATP